MGYEKALVIFIDILGSQNRQDFDELYKINSKFHDELDAVYTSQVKARNHRAMQRIWTVARKDEAHLQ